MKMDLTSIPGEDKEFGLLNQALEDRLELISEELFKKGTLRGDDINWGIIDTESKVVLQQISHMLAFRGMILSMIESGQSEDLMGAFKVGTVLFSAHYPKLHPQGKKFQRKKNNWASEIVAVLTKAVTGGQVQFDPNMVKTEGFAFCDAAAFHELDIAALRQGIDKAATAPSLRTSSKATDASYLGEESQADAPRKLDAKRRAQLRREVQTLAHRIFTHTPDAEISYQMRGYAGWMEFQFLPEADPSGKTELQTMPSSVLEEHQRVLSNPSLKDLYRLEERLLSNPDWFEGHWLASKLATQLGLLSAADAIRQRVAERLHAWPGLRELKFNNEKPFVSDKILAWVGNQNQTTNAEPPKKTDEKTEQGSEINDLLCSIDAEINAAKSLRDKALAKLRLLQAYKGLGHMAQARMMAEELRDLICVTSAKDWDEHMLKSIEAELN